MDISQNCISSLALSPELMAICLLTFLLGYPIGNSDLAYFKSSSWFFSAGLLPLSTLPISANIYWVLPTPCSKCFTLINLFHLHEIGITNIPTSQLMKLRYRENLPGVTGLITGHQPQTAWHPCSHWPQSVHCFAQGLSRWCHHSPSDSGSSLFPLFLSIQCQNHQQFCHLYPPNISWKYQIHTFPITYHDGQSTVSSLTFCIYTCSP